jgi:hypothetical protein
MMEECGIVLRNVKEYGRENVTNSLNIILMMKQVNGKYLTLIASRKSKGSTYWLDVETYTLN